MKMRRYFVLEDGDPRVIAWYLSYRSACRDRQRLRSSEPAKIFSIWGPKAMARKLAV